jgi:predicted PurR-regulated permease PerM
MLGLPPEPAYHHVREGVITVAGLGLVLFVMIASRMGHLATLAPILFSIALLAMLTPTVLIVRRRYRHILAAMLVLAMLLGLLAAAIHRYGYPVTFAFVVGPTPSAIADAVSPR